MLEHARFDSDEPLFIDEFLNPDAALLFGLNDSERESLDAAYQSFLREVTILEQSRLQRLDPPEPFDDGAYKVVARLPSLRAELEGALQTFESAITNTLGPQRSEWFLEHAKHFYNTELDGLGEAPRQFVVSPDNRHLGVYFQEKNYRSAHRMAFNLSQRGPWRYAHLFDPNEPPQPVITR